MVLLKYQGSFRNSSRMKVYPATVSSGVDIRDISGFINQINQINSNYKTFLNSTLSVFEVFVRSLLVVKLCFNQIRLLFAICDGNLENSTDSNNILVKVYLPYIQKDSLAYMSVFLDCPKMQFQDF